MRKNINKLVTTVFALAFLFTSCNNDDAFTYELPEQDPVASVTLSVVQSSDTQCAGNLTITTSDTAKVYYLILPNTVDAPTSLDVFRNGSIVTFDSAGSSTITTPNLTSGANYTIYAISVNKNGLRTEQVFTVNYGQPEYGINVDTSYTSVVTALDVQRPSHTATLTPIPGVANQFSIDSAWGPNFVAALTGNPTLQGQYLYAGTLTINSDFSVTIVGVPTSPWATGGTGSYNPCTNEISYTLTQSLFTNPFTTTVILTPDNL